MTSIANDGEVDPLRLAASVAELIQSFYRSTGDQNTHLDAQIKRFQNSDVSWRVAQILFEHTDPSVRYIAALTFEINIRKANKLSQDESAELARGYLDTLLRCLLFCLRTYETANVMRKICAALGVWSVTFHLVWTQAESEDLLYSWHSPLLLIRKLISNEPHRGVPHDDVQNQESRQTVYGYRILFAVIDEIFTLDQKFALEGSESSWLTTWRDTNLSAAIDVLHSSLMSGRHDVELQISAIEVIPLLIKNVVQSGRIEHLPVAEILNFVMASLEIEDLRSAAEDSLKAVIEESPGVLRSLPLSRVGAYLLQRSSEADNMLLIDDLDSAEAVAFANLLIPYAMAVIEVWGPPPANAIDVAVVGLLVASMSGQGIPGLDDDVFSSCLEFWYHVTDLAVDEEALPNNIWAVETLSQAVINLLRRLAETHVPEGDKDRQVFQEFRHDCKDWLTDAIPLLYPNILRHFLVVLQSCRNSSNLRDLETMLFVLQSAPLEHRSEQEADQVLDLAFELIQELPISQTSQPLIDDLLQSTMIDFIEDHDVALETNPRRVQAALTFLFSVVKSERQSLKAASAIYRICDSSRRFLFSRLNDILEAYNALYNQQLLTSETKPLLLGAMACLIEAVPLCQQSMDAISNIIQWIEVDAARWQGELKTRPEDQSGELALNVLVCLRNVARGLQEQAIDLDAAEDPVTHRGERWSVLGGQQLQQRAISIIQILWTMPNAATYLTTETCSILKKGYPESKPGLFVFPPQMTYDLFSASNIDSGYFETMLSTLQAMLNSPNEEFRTERHTVAQYAIPKISQVVHTLLSKDVGDDIALETATLELIATYVVKETNSMTHVDYRHFWDDILTFSLRSVQLPELLPRRKGLALWATIIEKIKDSPELLSLITPHGPTMASILFTLISGGALRSELDNVTITIQKLVMYGNVPGQWLNHAIMNNPLTSDNREQPPEERVRLKARLAATRNSQSKMRTVVKDWWQLCRGGIML